MDRQATYWYYCACGEDLVQHCIDEKSQIAPIPVVIACSLILRVNEGDILAKEAANVRDQGQNLNSMKILDQQEEILLWPNIWHKDLP